MSITRVLLTTFITLVGCSRTVDVPMNDLESVHDRKARHHVRMLDGSRYSVRQFTVTDSTLVIDDLSPTDVRKGAVTEPIVLPRDSIASVERLEGRQYEIFGIAAVIAVLLPLAYFIAMRT